MQNSTARGRPDNLSTLGSLHWACLACSAVDGHNVQFCSLRVPCSEFALCVTHRLAGGRLESCPPTSLRGLPRARLRVRRQNNMRVSRVQNQRAHTQHVLESGSMFLWVQCLAGSFCWVLRDRQLSAVNQKGSACCVSMCFMEHLLQGVPLFVYIACSCAYMRHGGPLCTCTLLHGSGLCMLGLGSGMPVGCLANLLKPTQAPGLPTFSGTPGSACAGG